MSLADADRVASMVAQIGEGVFYPLPALRQAVNAAASDGFIHLVEVVSVRSGTVRTLSVGLQLLIGTRAPLRMDIEPSQ